MKKTTNKDILENLKLNMVALDEKLSVKGMNVKNFDKTIKSAINNSIQIENLNKSIESNPSNYPQQKILIYKRRTKKFTFIDFGNFHFNIIDWFKIFREAYGIAFIEKHIGVYAALGIILILNDLIRIFQLDLPPKLSNILFIIWQLSEDKSNIIQNSKIISKYKKSFGEKLELKELKNRLANLNDLKIIKITRKSDGVRLVKKIII